MQKVTQFQLALGILCLAYTAAQAGEMSEAQKRTEFIKAYASAKPEDRIAAVNLLKGTKEQLSMQFLSQVVCNDAEADVRVAAFTIISDFEDPYGKLETVLLELFRVEKNRPTRIRMVPMFTKCKTKTVAIDDTIKLFSQLIYPEPYEPNWRDDNNNNNNNNNNNTTSSIRIKRRSKEEIEVLKKEFTDVQAVLNQLTGQNFTGTTNKVQDQVRKWWVLHKTDFAKAHAEMLLKLRDEASAASNKQSAAAKQPDEAKK